MKQRLRRIYDGLGPRNRQRVRILTSCASDLLSTISRERKRPVPVEDIRQALVDVGIVGGDAILVHSAMGVISRAGSVAAASNFDSLKYASDIIDMLMALVGPEGTIMVPTSPPTGGLEAAARGVVFDFQETPAGTGLIPNLLLQRPDVIRGLYPWQNATAWGRRAEFLMADHQLATPYAMDKHSPWYKINDVGGKVVLLGVDHARSSTLRVVENNYPVEFPVPVFYDKPHSFKYMGPDNRVEKVEMFLHAVGWRDGDNNKFAAYINDKYDVYREKKLHGSKVICFEAKKQFDAFYQEMLDNTCIYDCRFWSG